MRIEIQPHSAASGTHLHYPELQSSARCLSPLIRCQRQHEMM